MTLTFVTGNDEKWNLACAQMAPFGVELVRARFDLPEIQSFKAEDIAAEAAKLACAQVGGPVMVTDVGYALAGVGGFPGPYAKYTNHMLTPQDFLRLMDGVADRRFEIREALAYCEPGGVPQVFVSCMQGVIAETAWGERLMDAITILDGFDKPLAAYPMEEIRVYWQARLDHFTQLGEWLQREGKL